ncbi:Csu type fimbrial protein [Sinorhizobium garamanticum]|uniref:Csu type fimbrial protein n=1 Tax=Sinorhizobium garamanticum TaxID=680247 RepID=UPI003CC88710
MLGILALLLLAAMPAPARAQSCSFSVASVNFGSTDTLSGAPATTNATLLANCSGSPFSTILICPNLGSGSGGATASMRQMLSGADVLNYQLYSDSARTVVWGSQVWPFPSRPPAISVTLNGIGTGSASRQIYGALFGGQSTAPPGSYLSSFSGMHVEFRYRYSSLNSCSGGASGAIARPSFNVMANVAANCLVATQDVDFGSRGILDSSVDATGQLAVTCTPGSAYTVALNGGMANAPPTARKMFKGTETVTYGLYRDPARSQPWGDASTPGSTLTGTGNGNTQYLTVYGRVQSQTTPSPGVYTDTVVVTVTY